MNATITNEGFAVVVEVPDGSSLRIELNPETKNVSGVYTTEINGNTNSIIRRTITAQDILEYLQDLTVEL